MQSTGLKLLFSPHSLPMRLCRLLSGRLMPGLRPSAMSGEPPMPFFSRAAKTAHIALTALALGAVPAMAERIGNPVAEFTGVDKITGRIITFDVYIGETVQFGALQVTPRVCYSSPATEEPRTDSFVEVDEITLDRKIRRIFTGWMFAESPGLNAVEHAVYDVWLKACKQSSDVPPPEPNS